MNPQFTGKERDQETGLDYFGARYYSAAQGRWSSPDEFKGGFDDLDGKPAFSPGPLPYADISDPQTLNKYIYVRNNPLRYTDPNGHCFWDLCVAETVLTVAVGTAVVYYGYKLGVSIRDALQSQPQPTYASSSSKESIGTEGINRDGATFGLRHLRPIRD